MAIPRLHERFEAMLFRRKLEIEIAEILPDLKALSSAVQELKDSARFKQVLHVSGTTVSSLHSDVLLITFRLLSQVVLQVGNALNGSTFRGGARGFEMEALLKVRWHLFSFLSSLPSDTSFSRCSASRDSHRPVDTRLPDASTFHRATSHQNTAIARPVRRRDATSSRCGAK